jgi:hypothetical protein
MRLVVRSGYVNEHMPSIQYREPPWITAARSENQKDRLIKVICPYEIEPSMLVVSWEEGFELLSSFNWDSNEVRNIIYVPGISKMSPRIMFI